MSNSAFFEAILRDNHKESATRAVRKRGENYFKSKRIETAFEQEDHIHLHVRGSGYSEYCVDIYKEDDNIVYDCNCPAMYSYDICKHIVAALLYVEKEMEVEKASVPEYRWRDKIDAVMRITQYYGMPRITRLAPRLMFLSLQANRHGYGYALVPYRFNPALFPAELVKDEASIDNEVLAGYVVEHPELVEKARRIESLHSLTQGRYLNINDGLLSVIETLFNYSGYYDSDGLSRRLNALRHFDAPLFRGRPERPFDDPLTVPVEEATVYLDLTEGEDALGLTVCATAGETTIDLHQRGVEVIGAGPYWILSDSTLVRCASSYNHHLTQQFVVGGKLTIPKKQKSFFVNQYLVPLLDYMPLRGTALTRKTVESPLEAKQLYLEEQDGDLVASLRFKYGNVVVPHTAHYPTSAIQLDESDSESAKLILVEVYRDTAQEEKIYRETSSASYGLKYGTKQRDDLFLLRARVSPIDFLLYKLPILTADGYEIFGEETLKSARVNRHTPTISFNVSSGIDWFDIETLIQFGDVRVDLKEVRKSLRSKERFVKLADGTIGQIPEAWLQKYRHLFQLGEQDGESIRLSTHHVTLLDRLLAEADGVQVDELYQQRLVRLKAFEYIAEQPVPDGFVGELRPYQKAGLNWLHFLYDYGFGGCLADDMGLGKTIQVLALLQSLHERECNLPPTLIAVPRSLLVNWQREAEQFTPGLRITTHFGQTRPKSTDHFCDADIVLTTYGVVRRDVQLLRQVEFYYIILDESQAIKNPNAKIAKSVRLLHGRHRLVMTGTPVENSTFELWSQFAFLNPGLLGSADYFKKAFSNPIERNNDAETAGLLRQMVYPFILRRTKAQVALDLPPRSDRTIYVEMEKAQRRLYNKTRDEYRAQLLGLIEEEGMNSARFKVLEGLLRLRQICNHPRLVQKRFRGDSAKQELLFETLQTLQQEGHKALIFSQFVQMLHIVRDEMKQRGMTFTYLDGRTQNRQARVDEFQNDPSLSFFLISLKAGGVGLNLTAADYVIHIDPWWNPAVEMQASDRSHRIGQDKPVFVYKLITKDSVEEKILELQARKKTLVEQLITSEGGMLKQLTATDVQVLFS